MLATRRCLDWQHESNAVSLDDDLQDSHAHRRRPARRRRGDHRSVRLSGSIVIRARVENAEGLLRPGLFVRVRLILTVTENAILIPEEALVPVGSEQFVFRIVDGRVMNTKVQIGERLKGDVQVVGRG